MNTPCTVVGSSFQSAWIQAVKKLDEMKWHCHNLVVHVENVAEFDLELHDKLTNFSKSIGKLSPKDVAYTVFPHKLYRLTCPQLLYHSQC